MKKLKNIFNNLIKKLVSDEVKNLARMLKNINSFKKISLWIIFLPITFFFLTLNLFVYIYFLIYYNLIFFLKILQQKVWNKKNIKKIYFKKNFNWIENNYIIFLKNILLDLPKSRAYLVFYTINNKIFKKEKQKIKLEELKNIFKIIANRYLILIIFGFPYLVLYCNTWLVDKFLILNTVRKIKKIKIKDFILFFLLNINRDLTPVSVIFIKKLKIKFFFKKIIFNPGEKNLTKMIEKIIQKNNLSRNIEILKQNSYISLTKNVISVDKEKNIIKYSKPHLETSIILNDENRETISINETSKEKLYEFENFIYNSCTFKKGNCFITKPIISKLEYKEFLKESINYKINKNNWDEAFINQLLALICQLQDSYLVGKWDEKENIIKFKLEENKNDNLINFLRKNKNFLKNDVFEVLENSNNFLLEMNEIYENLDDLQKNKIINNNIYGNLINNNKNIFEMIKFK